ncbi:SusC/RagA family TonB-linked outer membrane protein [Winogradskyella vidalii]|uniref:SusC/RagA family TonB-linked outer membrane protein n=1 Tax=Winogradskyella vidalii TaxID=2615024 RepID=UPI0015CE7F6B|nr:SusC/RagA family TonB-linked outer membrane protein [Winogradskyella vidalii]
MKYQKFILSTVIILTSLCHVYGSTPSVNHNINGHYVNNKTINLQLKKASLIQVFNLIEKQTDLKFIYISNALYQNTKIDLNVNNQPLETVLKTLKQKSPIDFKVTDNGILVKPIAQSASKINQENITIKGVVYDETNTPVLGANIYATEHNIGAVTDYDGQFTITVPADTKTLKVTYIGYEEVDYTLNGELEITVSLTPYFAALNEVVITGQGASVQRKRLSNNVEVLKSEDLAGLPSQRIDQLIATKLPNTQINFTGGQSGATTLIRSRGVNSAFLSSTPVFYIDGVRMDNLNTTSALGGGSSQGAAMSSIADIPMDNIERIEYINGGAATTLYGSDAANGVIQIFTKKGSSRGTQITASTQMGIVAPTTDFLYFERSKDLLFTTGTYQKYNLSISGGNSEGFGYSFSGNFLSNSGAQIADNNANKKVDFSTGFKAKLGEKVTYNSSFIYVNNHYNRNRNGNQGGYTGLWFAESGASVLKGFNNRLDEMSAAEFSDINDFVKKAEELQDNEISINRFTTSQSFSYKPVNNFETKFVGGIDYRVQNDQTIQTNEYLSHTTQTSVTDEGNIANIERKYFGITLELSAQHKFETGQFSFISTIGGQLFRNSDHQIQYVGTNIRDGAQTISDAAIKTSEEYLAEVLNYGFYFQENIGFKDKLFLDLGIRGDRNPSFGDNIGTQYYPKAGVSYLLSSEPWLENSTAINSLRLRGNYGVAGNLPPAFVNERTIDFDGFLGEQAAFFGQSGNPDLKPEKTSTFEVGVDATLFNNRVNLSVGYYNANTKDALFYVPPTPSSGYASSQLYNIGEIENKGWEINASFIPIQTDNVSLSFNVSVNTLDNLVVNSGGVAPFNINGFSARTIQTVVEEGYPIGYIRGNYGTFDDNGVLESTTAQSYLGTTIPDLFGNLGMNFAYKSFSFFANGNYQKGAYANSFDQQFRFLYGASDDIVPAAEVEANGTSNWLNFTNLFTEKTDFIKIRTMGVNYNFIPKKTNTIKSILIGFSVNNPLNFTASTFDPEATISGSATGQGGASTGGISYATYSAPREFLTSLKINF